MAEMTAALDQTGATRLVAWAESQYPEVNANGTRPLGPLSVDYTVRATFEGGTVTLSPPRNLRLAGAVTRFQVRLSITLDVSRLIPDFCLPQVCVNIPLIGRVCVPPTRVCIDWPSVTIPVSYTDTATFTVDLRAEVRQENGSWVADTVILGTPSVQLGVLTGLLQSIRNAADAVLRVLPYIGPLLAKALDNLIASISGSLGGVLGSILTAVIGGTRFELYRQPTTLTVVVDGTGVSLTLDSVAVDVVASDENELVLGIDIS
jgi:hypothetical protein